MWTAKEQQTWANHRVHICRRHEATKAIKRSTVWCNPISWFWTFEDSELHQGQWEDTLRSNSLTRVWQTNLCAQTSKNLSSFWEQGTEKRKIHLDFMVILKWRTRTQILEKGGFTSLVLFLRSFGLRPYWLFQAGRCRRAQLLHFAQSWWVALAVLQESHGYPITKFLQLLRTWLDLKISEVHSGWRRSTRETIPKNPSQPSKHQRKPWLPAREATSVWSLKVRPPSSLRKSLKSKNFSAKSLPWKRSSKKGLSTNSHAWRASKGRQLPRAKKSVSMPFNPKKHPNNLAEVWWF